MEVRRGVSLKEYTTFKIGGNADFFCHVTSKEELMEAVLFAQEQNVPVFVLGGGSNVLFADSGFRGLVIQNGIKGVVFESKSDNEVFLTSGAGEIWDDIVKQSVERNLCGLENLSFIPGSVGAAPIQNIGAYGVEVKDTLVSVVVFDMERMQFISMTKDDCVLGYRNSIFKTKEGKKYVVVSVTFRLWTAGLLSITYPDLDAYFREHVTIKPTIQTVREAVIFIRKQKLPDVATLGTAGSFFKNPIISEKTYQTLKTRFPDMSVFSTKSGEIKVSAGWLIDKIGNWKGYRVGGAGVYEKQALVLVNYKEASSRDVVALAEMIEEDIKNKTGIVLEREVCVL